MLVVDDLNMPFTARSVALRTGQAHIPYSESNENPSEMGTGDASPFNGKNDDAG